MIFLCSGPERLSHGPYTCTSSTHGLCLCFAASSTSLLSSSMSTASLPSYYLAPNLSRTPAYTEEPQEHEQRIALSDRLRSRNSGTFVKQSRNGEARLTLNAQNGPIPTYGSGGIIDGTIEIAKTENITSIDIKVCKRLCGLTSLLDCSAVQGGGSSAS